VDTPLRKNRFAAESHFREAVPFNILLAVKNSGVALDDSARKPSAPSLQINGLRGLIDALREQGIILICVNGSGVVTIRTSWHYRSCDAVCHG